MSETPPILVISASRGDFAELEKALFQQLDRQEEFASELLHFTLVPDTHDGVKFPDFSVLLQSIFAAVFLVPPVSTWSRARHAPSEGQPLLRDHRHPFGLGSLSPEQLQRVRVQNHSLEFRIMALEVFFSSQPNTPFIFVAPEDR